MATSATVLTAPLADGDYVRHNGAAFVNHPLQILVAEHLLSSGTPGGAVTPAAWTTRSLNTLVSNSITGASLASDQITLPAGTYNVECFMSMGPTTGKRLRFRNITDSTDALVSMSQYGYNGGIDFTWDLSARGVFTISGAKVFAVQYYAAASGVSPTEALGVASAVPSYSEKYVSVTIRRI